jgi:hypothetical protein
MPRRKTVRQMCSDLRCSRKERYADLKKMFPTCGQANTMAVTVHGGLEDSAGAFTPWATRSTAFRVESAAPRLWPVTVMLVSSSL